METTREQGVSGALACLFTSRSVMSVVHISHTISESNGSASRQTEKDADHDLGRSNFERRRREGKGDIPEWKGEGKR